MPGEDLPFGIDVGADGLSDADDHPTGERPPETPEPADDHRLEGIEQARRPDGRIERRAHAEVERSNRDDHHGDRHGHGENASRFDAHELRDVGIVRGRPEGTAKRRRVEQGIEQQDDRDCRDEGDKRHHADRKHAAERDRGGLDGAGREPLAVRRKHLQEAVLDDDRKPERHQQRRQDVGSKRAVEHEKLQRIAGRKHQGERDRGCREGIEAECARRRQDDEGREHDEIAMGKIDEPHDPEDEGQSRREQRVEAAQEHALDDRVDPTDHHAVTDVEMFRRIEIKPSDLILRRPRSSRGRLEGWPQARYRLWPSFETRASFDKLRSALLRTRLMDNRCDSYHGNAVLDRPVKPGDDSIVGVNLIGNAR